MDLYNDRNKIIKLFEDKAISHSMHGYDAKSHGVEESEQEYDESTGERVKLGRQKPDELNKMITENENIMGQKLFKNYFSNFEKISNFDFLIQKELRKTKNAQKNKKLVGEIRSEFFD